MIRGKGRSFTSPAQSLIYLSQKGVYKHKTKSDLVYALLLAFYIYYELLIIRLSKRYVILLP